MNQRFSDERRRAAVAALVEVELVRDAVRLERLVELAAFFVITFQSFLPWAMSVAALTLAMSFM